jgi:hypothetical protein
MVFMIDTDVVQGNTQTTVLHWFQPDLVPEGDNLVLVGNVSTNLLLKVDDAVAKRKQRRQAPPLPPGATPGPNNVNPALVGATAQTVYLGPGPPPGPPHRYVQVLFAQPRNFTFPACFQNILTPPGQAPDPVGRVGFDLNQFIKAAKLPTRPLAGNYFRAQNPQPGSLSVNAAVTSLKNNQCAGATPAPKAMARRWHY